MILLYISVLDTAEEKDRFARIYEENYLLMYHVALGILTRQAEAENAVHEAFLSLAENFKKYSGISCSEMKGLCVIIVKNKAIDQLRRERRMTEQELEELVIADDSLTGQPEWMAERGEEVQKLKKVLAELPEILKETLVLKYCYDYSNRQIAKLLGVSVKTVEMRLYRGKQKMRELLKEAEWE